MGEEAAGGEGGGIADLAGRWVLNVAEAGNVRIGRMEFGAGNRVAAGSTLGRIGIASRLCRRTTGSSRGSFDPSCPKAEIHARQHIQRLF